MPMAGFEPRTCESEATAVPTESEPLTKDFIVGQCCDSIGREAASDAKGPRFESSHGQTLKSDIYLCTVNCIERTEKRKRVREWPI